MTEDWPHELFVEKADLYLLQLEERLAQAEAEADHLVNLLATYGVPAAARIIDLCCGIGRHSVALAKRGYNVVGVDFSLRFLERAQILAKEADVQDRATFVLWDARQLQNFPQKGFDAALCLFSSFVGYYTEEEDQKFFTSVRELLRPGGVFVLDPFPRDRIIRSFQPIHVGMTKSHMIVQENSFDLVTSRISSRWFFFLPEGEGWRYARMATMNFRAYAPHELIHMLQEAGWKYCAAYGGLDMGPLGLESRRCVVVAQNPG